jgi:uncharacterized protein (TIGR02147 family)
METARIDIFQYADFRAFLQDHYLHRKSAEPKFSQRFIMDKVGASSPSWFNDVVKGRIRLTGTYLVRLGQLLKLKPKELDYFETLVHYQQADSLDEKNRYMEKLMSFKDLRMDVLGREKFEFYAHWYYTTVRELLFFHDFDGDYGKLAKKLRPAIRKEQAARAIELLEKLDLIRKRAGGHYRPTSENIIKDSRFKSDYIANFIKASIELALDAFERVPSEERDLSTVTLSLSAQGFEEVKSELKGLRRRFLEIAERDTTPDRVYQCNLHVFPTTQV